MKSIITVILLFMVAAIITGCGRHGIGMHHVGSNYDQQSTGVEWEYVADD